jgi:predicted AlkP superfamily phosphohydrolase/phosphomutase
MSSRDGPAVLAVAIDALEPGFAARLMEDGRLPHLSRLRQEGRFSEVASTAHVGSGAVWPSFLTGVPPTVHGVSSEWQWDPGSMQVHRYDGSDLVPFWRDLVAKGVRVGVLDVPFAPLVGMDEGFEISEWGAHDVFVARTDAAPEVARRLVAEMPPHHFSEAPVPSEEIAEPGRLDVLAGGALTGIERRGDLFARLVETSRPDLALVVFPEIHHLGHLMWHTVDGPPPPISLADMMSAIDAQIGRLSSLVRDGGSIVVFSLHGMKPARGLPTFLGPLLRSRGFSQAPTWGSLTGRERALAGFSALKRHSPTWLKDLYHRRADYQLQLRWARPTMLEQQDWRRTRAFALPTDQYGRGRVNLAGRERDGIVAGSDYEALCDDIEHELMDLRNGAGTPLVERVVRPAQGDPSLRSTPLADLVVHWGPGADQEPLGVPELETEKISRYRTGQHTPAAFCITTGPATHAAGDVIANEDIHRVIRAGLP